MLICCSMKQAVLLLFVKLLQVLKAHLDYKERTKLISSSDVMTENTVVNQRSVS